MDIRFVSTLTPEDEERVAQSLVTAVAALLDDMAFAYTIRIMTTGERMYQHHHPAMNNRAEPLPSENSPPASVLPLVRPPS